MSNLVLRLCFLGGGIGGSVILAVGLLRRHTSMVQKRFRRRDPQPNEIFLAACGVAGADHAKIAIAVREVLAEMGGVPAASLWASDKFDSDLQWLPFCNFFYISDFADQLARKSGFRLQGKHLTLPHPDIAPRGMTLGEFTVRILKCV